MSLWPLPSCLESGTRAAPGFPRLPGGVLSPGSREGRAGMCPSQQRDCAPIPAEGMEGVRHGSTGTALPGGTARKSEAEQWLERWRRAVIN